MPPSSPRRTAPARLALGLAAAACAVLGVPATTAGGVPAAAADGFTVYTNERGDHQVDLAQYGAVKSTVVYDYFAFTCDDNGCYADGGALPDAATYRAKVQDYMSAAQFGGGAGDPVVLDFEKIAPTELSGPAATNAANLWTKLITWTHQAAPQAPVGMYGYDSKTTNNDLTRQLHADGLLDFFAPRGYRSASESDADWDATMDAAIANDRSLAPGQPIYPYISPHWDGTPDGTYMSGNTWGHTVTYLESRTEGAVVWEPSANGADACPWVSQNAYEMGQLTGTPSTGTLRASVPSADCVVRRGTTTSVPVTITNTGSGTSSAASLSLTAPDGITGSFDAGTVPALAAGDTWSTTLTVSVPSGQQDSTALLHIRPGTGDTRWAAVVR